MDIVGSEKTLQELLSKSNVKQLEMAEILSISESHVSLLVSGKRRMNMDYAAAFAKRLNITIDEVFHAVNFAKGQEHITLKLGKADGVSKLSQYGSNPKLADFRNSVAEPPKKWQKSWKCF